MASTISSLSKLDDSSQVINKLLGRAFFGGNLGIGVDLAILILQLIAYFC